jgi:hypothetical protein
MDRHVFRHGYDEWNFRFNGFFDGFCGLVSWDIDR